MRPVILVLCVLFAVLWQRTESEYSDYICGYTATDGPCQNGGNCKADGTCECPNGFKGHDCGVADSAICAQDQCNDNGECPTDSTCACNPDSYGENCQYKRHSVRCERVVTESATLNKLRININRLGLDLDRTSNPSTAAIDGKPTCSHTALAWDGKPEDYQGFALDISLAEDDANCGAVYETDVDGEGSSTESGDCVTIVVKYMENTDSYLDYRAKFCCSSYEAGDGIYFIGFGGTLNDPEAPFLQDRPIVIDDPVGLTFSMDDETGNPLGADTEYNVGDPVYLTVTQKDGDTRAVKITDCRASENEYTVNPNNFEDGVLFVDDTGCLVPGLAIAKDVVIDENNLKTTVEATVVRVGTSTRTYYRCKVTMCADATGACAITSCPNDNGGSGRGKREVTPADNSTVVTHIEHAVQLRPLKTSDCTNADVESHDRDTIFFASVLSLGGVILILLVIIAVLGICLLKRQRHEKSPKESF